MEIDYSQIPDDMLAAYVQAYEHEGETIKARSIAAAHRSSVHRDIARLMDAGSTGWMPGFRLLEEAKRRSVES
jgi:hypothetical protein